MQAATSPVRQARARHRHDLRVLTYVILDEGNGGIVRNLSDEGIAVQAVGALRPRQNVRLRFELRHPQFRVETRGEVMWASPSGQCGIRFLDLPRRTVREINAWIFGDLLECAEQYPGSLEDLFGAVPRAEGSNEADGGSPDNLFVSASPLHVIHLDPQPVGPPTASFRGDTLHSFDTIPATDWLSQPLSGRSLAWTLDSLIVFAALLLFSLVFLGVTHELPKWPVATAAGATIFVAAFYWGFFELCGGPSMGDRLARLVMPDREEDEEFSDGNRFR
jgi:PilZ domain